MILVTGGTGFIGSRLLHKLVKRGYQVAAIYRPESSFENVKDIKDSITWVLNNDEEIQRLFADNGIQGIIHCSTNYGRGDTELFDVMDSNVIFPLKLLRYACQNGADFFINTDSFYTREIGDKWEVNQRVYMNSYCKSKFIFRECARENIDNLDIIFVNAELQHVYGSGDGKGKFVSYLVNELKNNAKEIELSTGTQVRDWIFVDDVVEAYIKIIESSNSFARKSYYNYEVGTGIGTSLKEFCLKVKEISGADTVLSFGKRKMNENELMYSVADNKSLVDLGWKPKIDLEEGIRRLVEQCK